MKSSIADGAGEQHCKAEDFIALLRNCATCEMISKEDILKAKIWAEENCIYFDAICNLMIEVGSSPSASAELRAAVICVWHEIFVSKKCSEKLAWENALIQLAPQCFRQQCPRNIALLLKLLYKWENFHILNFSTRKRIPEWEALLSDQRCDNSFSNTKDLEISSDAHSSIHSQCIESVFFPLSLTNDSATEISTQIGTVLGNSIIRLLQAATFTMGWSDRKHDFICFTSLWLLHKSWEIISPARCAVGPSGIIRPNPLAYVVSLLFLACKIQICYIPVKKIFEILNEGMLPLLVGSHLIGSQYESGITALPSADEVHEIEMRLLLVVNFEYCDEHISAPLQRLYRCIESPSESAGDIYVRAVLLEHLPTIRRLLLEPQLLLDPLLSLSDGDAIVGAVAVVAACQEDGQVACGRSVPERVIQLLSEHFVDCARSFDALQRLTAAGVCWSGMGTALDLLSARKDVDSNSSVSSSNTVTAASRVDLTHRAARYSCETEEIDVDPTGPLVSTGHSEITASNKSADVTILISTTSASEDPCYPHQPQVAALVPLHDDGVAEDAVIELHTECSDQAWHPACVGDVSSGGGNDSDTEPVAASLLPDNSASLAISDVDQPDEKLGPPRSSANTSSNETEVRECRLPTSEALQLICSAYCDGAASPDSAVSIQDDPREHSISTRSVCISGCIDRGPMTGAEVEQSHGSGCHARKLPISQRVQLRPVRATAAPLQLVGQEHVSHSFKTGKVIAAEGKQSAVVVNESVPQPRSVMVPNKRPRVGLTQPGATNMLFAALKGTGITITKRVSLNPSSQLYGTTLTSASNNTVATTPRHDFRSRKRNIVDTSNWK